MHNLNLDELELDGSNLAELLSKALLESMKVKLIEAGYIVKVNTTECEDYLQKSDDSCAGCESNLGCSKLALLAGICSALLSVKVTSRDDVTVLEDIVAYVERKIINKEEN